MLQMGALNGTVDIPSFFLAGRVETLDDIDAYTDLLWENLNADNKISLYVRYTALKGGAVEQRIVNKHI